MAKNHLKLALEYDANDDVLYASLGKPRPSLGEDLENGVTVFRDEETGEIVGFDVYGFADYFKHHQKKLEIPLTPRVGALASR